MYNFLSKLEKKIGKYAITNLPMVLIIMYGVGYIMTLINPELIYVLSLNPYAIAHGQVWRLVTWLLIPPNERNFFFVIVMLYCYYSISLGLQRTWGKFYFNVYIFSGMLFTTIGAFLLMAYYYYTIPDYVAMCDGAIPALYGGNSLFALSSTAFSTYYINMSILLAFAATYPNTTFYIFFILPINAKALGIIYVIYLTYSTLQNGMLSFLVFVASMLNFILYFFTLRKPLTGRFARNVAQAAAAKEYKRKMQSEKMKPQGVAKHKCAICGQTSDTNPDLQFRFCSKCEGNYEYCQNHLFTHTHKKRDN